MAEKTSGVLTIRADEEIKMRFKSLAENLGNQGVALESLLNAYEMQNAKNVLTERKTDIEDFDTHLQAISSAFLHSLEIAQNTTERVRAEFQNRLDSKEQTIQDLQERIRQAEQAEQTARAQATAIESDMSTLSEQTSIQLANLKSELDSVKKALTTATEQVMDKQSLLDEYRTRLEKAEKDIAELPALKEMVQAKKAAEQEAERLAKELSKQKADFESKIQLMQEKAEIAQEKAVLVERAKATERIQALVDETKQLYNEIAELHKEKAIAEKTKKN